MTLPQSDTIVTYPAGALASTSTVLHVERRSDDTVAVLLDTTAAHPVDAGWPDQGPDLGTLAGHPLRDVVVGATDGEALHLGRDIPVRKGTEGWAFVVVHLLDAFDGAEGDPVEVIVDAGHRAALSLGHTACHLASLALNAALAEAWTKEIPRDAAGHPDFDGVAIETSTIVPGGSRDEYRIGRSTRKKGFDTAALDDLPVIEAAANAWLAAAVAADTPVRIVSDGPGLTDRRRWTCGEWSIACGGTHAASTGALAHPSIRLERRELDGAIGLTMVTTA